MIVCQMESGAAVYYRSCEYVGILSRSEDPCLYTYSSTLITDKQKELSYILIIQFFVIMNAKGRLRKFNVCMHGPDSETTQCVLCLWV